MVRLSCPACKKILQISEQLAGKKIACPHCKQVLQLPATLPNVGAAPAAEKAAAKPAPAVTSPPGRPPAAPAEAWHYVRGKQRFGPVSWTELRQLAASAQLQPDDYVLKTGTAKWMPGKSLPDLFPPAPARPGPAPALEVPPAAEPQPLEPVPVQPPLWQRIPQEALAVVTATVIQTAKPVRYLRGLRRLRKLERRAGQADLVLGRRLYEARLGDEGLRTRVRKLDEEIRSVEATRGATKQLHAEQGDLLLQLAAPVLAQATPPADAETEFQQARAARGELQAQQEKLKAARSLLLPSGLVQWRRVGIGYGTVVAAIALAVALPLALRKPRAPDVSPPVVAAPLPDLTTEQIVARAEKSVALIRSEHGFGTGFLVRPGIVATNAHVIRIAPIDQLKIFFPSNGETGKKPITAKSLLYEDKKRDLAFLSLETDLPPLPVTPQYVFKRGQSVTVIGNPGGGGELTLENAVSQGIMSTPSQINKQDFFQLSISINPGNSGGPVFDSTGRVIGVVTLKAKKEEGVAFCIPGKELEGGIAKAEGQAAEAVSRATAQHDLEVVFRRTATAGSMYGAAMQFYASVARQAVAQGRPASAGFSAARQQAADSLKTEDHALLDDIQPTMTRITADPQIAQPIRTQLIELWTTYKEMKDYVNNPTGTLPTFEAKARALADKHNRLVEALKLALGVEDLD